MSLLAELDVWIKKKRLAIVISIGGMNIAIISALSAFQSVLFLQPETVHRLVTLVLVFDLVVVVVVCYYAFVKRRAGGVIAEPKPLSQLCYQVEPSRESDVRWAAELALQVYQGYDAIPEKVMLNWFQANPNGFSVVKRGDGVKVGNLDLLALKPNTLRDFIGGELLEKEILGDCLYGPDETASVRNVYVESLVVPRHLFKDDTSNSAALHAIIASLSACILKLCEKDIAEKGEIKVYALSANPVVTKHLVEMGSQIVSHRDKRRDGHDLYCIDFKSLESQLKIYADRRS
ncbi:MAG: hypothetical protein ABSF70_07330 [Terracidiphilus sp.]|jgi:hypothetical protein